MRRCHCSGPGRVSKKGLGFVMFGISRGLVGEMMLPRPCSWVLRREVAWEEVVGPCRARRAGEMLGLREDGEGLEGEALLDRLVGGFVVAVARFLEDGLLVFDAGRVRFAGTVRLGTKSSPSSNAI